MLPRFEMSRTAVNAVACAVRVLCMLLCALLVPRLRVVNRFAMYRGAINKVLNAIPDDGEKDVTQACEQAGLPVVEVTRQGEWVSVTARRPLQ